MEKDGDRQMEIDIERWRVCVCRYVRTHIRIPVRYKQKHKYLLQHLKKVKSEINQALQSSSTDFLLQFLVAEKWVKWQK